MMRVILFTSIIISMFSSQVFGNFTSHVTVYQLNKLDENILHEIDTRLPTSYAHTHDASFRISGGRNWTLDLHLNKELIPATFTKYILTKDGMNKVQTINKDFHHCNYQGTIRGMSSSQVVVNTCHGLDGYILLNKELYKIKPMQNGFNGVHLLTKSSSSTFGENKTCGTDDDVMNEDGFDWDEDVLYRARRDAMEEDVVKPKQKIIEALFVADKSLCDRFEDRSQVEDHVKKMVNLIDGYFSELGIRVVLSYLEIWEDRNPMTLTKSPSYSLDKFQKHHRNSKSKLSSGWKKADLALLLFGTDFYSTTVGQAYVGNVCHGSPVGIVQDLNLGNDVETAFVTTHEMGHILGLSHNRFNCRCSRHDCVMDTPYTSPITAVDWSPCSKAKIESLKNSDDFPCLENIPDSATLISDPVCGNEIVDPNEDCDCGTPEICESSCCNPLTCKFNAGAVCDKGKCCHNCQLKEMKALCEPLNDNECDLPEYCDGLSETCPMNLYKRNGSPCGDGDGLCNNGTCISHDLQCQALFGPDATAADFCYDSGKYTMYQIRSCLAHQKKSTCRIEQHKCRTLRCTNYDSRFTTSKFSQYNLRAIHQWGGWHPHGWCISMDTYQSTLDNAEDGLKCGPNKVCKDQDCIHDPLATCEEKCNGNGICNNMGNCNCNDGWKPPFCDRPGTGGSIDTLHIRTFSVCGNDATEGEEECDCGSPEVCQDKCCDPLTCRLKAKGTRCRDATKSCDLSEVCDGESPNCPLDVAKIAGTTCGNEGSCYQGDCVQSRDQQCQLLIRQDAVNDPTPEQNCYQLNSYRYSSVRPMGNCGRDNDGNLKQCAFEDNKCGKLMCSVGDTQYNGMKEITVNTDHTVRYQIHSFGARGTMCVLAITKKNAIEFGDRIGLVSDGTTCGQNKMCVNQQCQDMSEDPDQCTASRCNGHGICNNGGGCQCEEGFQPPNCTQTSDDDIL